MNWKNVWRGPETKQEKRLVYISGFLMAVLLIFLIALCVVATTCPKECEAFPSKQSTEECNTQSCKEAAEDLLQSMDTSVDPCHDFYRYACGGWIDNHPIPAEKGRYTAFDLQRDLVSDKLARDLKGALSGNYTEIVKQSAILYQGCIDEESRQKQGLEPLKNIVKDNGGWPMADPDWVGTDYIWHKRLATLTRTLSVSPVIYLSVEADANKTSQHIISLDEGAFGLGRNQLINMTSTERNREIIAAYRTYIISTAKLLNPKANETQLAKDADEIIEFESSMAKLTRAPEDLRDAKSWYHKMTVTKAQEVTENTYFIWLEFISGVLQDFPGVTRDTEIMVAEIDYIKNVLKLFDSTKPRLQANYIGWILVKKYGPQTTKEFRANAFEFMKAKSGVQKDESLERTCTDQVVGLLGNAVGRLYVDRYFSEKDKHDVEKLVEDIRHAYELTLKNNVWMDEATTNKAIDKLKSITSMMGYPPWIKDDDKLNEYYKGVSDLKQDKYFESLTKSTKAAMAIQLKKWNQPTKRTTEWITEPSVVNAFYSPRRNTITFPAGILNLPFYTYGRPLPMNFGGIGSVIGHEISHGFDDEGSQYDMEGNLINWWSEETRDKFDEKANCFRNQYSSYVEPTTNMNLNGNNSVGENIADNGGLRNAFLGYKLESLLSEGSEVTMNKRLPKVSATPEQLFFLGYAGVWCGSIRKESLEMSIQYDTHSPNEFRVLIPLSNSQAFAEAFNCPVGSRMNPESKCLLW